MHNVSVLPKVPSRSKITALFFFIFIMFVLRFRNVFLTTLQGLPTATEFSGMERVTALPASNHRVFANCYSGQDNHATTYSHIILYFDWKCIRAEIRSFVCFFPVFNQLLFVHLYLLLNLHRKLFIHMSSVSFKLILRTVPFWVNKINNETNTNLSTNFNDL